MKKLWILITLLAFENVIMAQGEIPDEVESIVRPKDTLGDFLSAKSPLKGVFIQYGQVFPYGLHSTLETESHPREGKVIRDEDLLIKYKIPVFIRDSLKILIGHNYYSQRLSFDPHLKSNEVLHQLHAKTLKNNRFSAYMLWELDSNHAINMTSSLAFNGDYDQFVEFAKRYRIFRTIALYTINNNINKEWGVGVYFKHGFRSSYILPFAIFNYDFNKKWGVEAIIITKLMFRYNHSPKSIFFFGGEYSSRDFSIDIDYRRDDGQVVDEAYWMKWPKIYAQAVWQREIIEILWFEVVAGWQFNLDPEISGRLYTRDLTLDITSRSPFVKAGIFLTPPKKWLD